MQLVERISARINAIDRIKKNYRCQATEERISFEELRLDLSQMDEEVAALNDQVHSLNNRQQKLAELKRGAEIVLSIYAGRLAASDRMSAEERQDLYRRLGLPITINPGGIVRIEGYLVANFVPLPDQINSPSVELR